MNIGLVYLTFNLYKNKLNIKLVKNEKAIRPLSDRATYQL